MGTPEFPDLGKHCSVSDCRQLDFLPFTCDRCNQVHCLEHRSYTEHQCKKPNKQDVTVVICPLCAQGVRLIPDQDPNITWENHVNIECDPSNYDKVTKKKKKCPAPGCREDLVFSNTIKCRDCLIDHCLKHRFGTDHKCSGPKKLETSFSFMSLLNRSSRREEPNPNLTSTTSSNWTTSFFNVASNIRASAEAGMSKLSDEINQAWQAARDGVGQDSGSGNRNDQVEQCPQCDAKSSSVTALVEHVQKVHEGSGNRLGVKKVTIDPCPKCSKGFLDSVSLVEHVESAHGAKQHMYVVSSCHVITDSSLLPLSFSSENLLGIGILKMSAVSGVISRHVLPACGNLCVFCPSMRARSRQPVKRYKKLIADIFPRNQEEGANDRKVGKLCDYAARNPLRIPKIVQALEQRCYKELRNENFHSTKIVMYIYKKFLVSCKEQMPLFASSLLSIIHTLLDQTRQDEMRTLGCQILFDFVNNQTDGSYLFSLEAVIPKLCQFAQETGDDERARRSRSAGLKALSSMVRFMGENSHISVEFDNIVSAVLENYEVPERNSESLDHEQQGPESRWVQDMTTNEDQITPLVDVKRRNPSWSTIVNDKGEVNVAMEDDMNPSFWSGVCLHNMANLAKEGTTIRRVMESLFRYFDNGNLWSINHGLAFSVLKDMLFLTDDSEKNTHVLLSMLIKHLDHKIVLKDPNMQLDIVEVTTSLSQFAKVQPSVSIIGSISDMMRHLRKSIQYSLDSSNMAPDVISWNKKFRKVVDRCLVQLSNKVGEADPILDVMAMMLENISTITMTSRTTIFAVFRTAQIVASLPNLSYQNKAFPEALFHHLLRAMVNPDHETRVVAHRIFSVIIVPASVFPHPSVSYPKALNVPHTLSRAVSVFSSSAVLFEKLRLEKRSLSEKLSQCNIDGEIEAANSNRGILNRLKSTHSRVSSVNNPPLQREVDQITANNDQNLEAAALRLSRHQINRLLSSIWIQSISPGNMPANYEVIAQTYTLVLLVSRAKNSFHEVLVRSFQLAFSLWNMSLKEGPLPPSRRRSLFTLATSMIVFSAKAYNIVSLVNSAKAVLKERKVDPFLQLIEDHKLQVVSFAPDNLTINYGSKEDDDRATDTLTELLSNIRQTQELFASEIIKSLEIIAKAEISSIREQLLEDFLPDATTELRSQLTMKMPRRNASIVSIDDDFVLDSFESQIKHNPEMSMEAPSLLSANQLLELVLDTSHPSGRISVSTAFNMPYKDMADNCEVRLMGKQKMSKLMSTQKRQECFLDSPSPNHDNELKNMNSSSHRDLQKVGNPPFEENTALDLCKPTSGISPVLDATEHQNHSHLFKLPAASPYDNFLKAAALVFGVLHPSISHLHLTDLKLQVRTLTLVPFLYAFSISSLPCFPLKYMSLLPFDFHASLSIRLDRFSENRIGTRLDSYSVIMSAKYVISAILGSFGVAWACDYSISDKKIFGGTTPGTVSNNEWWEETDKKFQSWPRTAGPPVVMNPITRQNFIVKSRSE
ncbi:hypothetical protein VNO77_17110 [Canavalia gladiata]|uniref:Uncharacterized protein n=1 Tax=Canavalia gladiata TaxID=3824 RepID=A0AAN9LIB4_CANGL